MKFVHLHLHTEYSLIDGIVRIGPLLDKVAELEMPAVAMTDQSNLFAMVKFYKAALKKGIKPIIGAEVYLENEKQPNKPFSVVLLCQSPQGYRHLTEILSRGFTEGQHHDKAVIQKAWLKHHAEGLIVLSGASQGDIGQALLHEKKTEAKKLLEEWLSLFPNRFYLELQRTGRENEEFYIQSALDLAEDMSVPVVATHDVRFLAAEDFEAHEARVCIHDGFVLDDQKRPHLYTENQYLCDEAEMITLFEDIPEAISNTVEIAKRCNLTLTLDQAFLPEFPIPEGMTVESYLAQLSQEGLKERRLTNDVYQERLEIELKVINQMGFAGYFLIVADFIQWAKKNHIPVGPGRGSGAGSLVAYVLHITDLDPLEYDLLFERFLNPERVSMPDFDIDFCMEGRDRVIEYVAQKYGRDSVSQIITFGTMAAKAVVRDVGRVLNHPYGFVDKIAKLIPFEIGMTLTKALEDEPLLKERYDEEEDVRTLIDLAKKLEGVARNAGKHAGGVVIAPGKITDFSPLYCEAGTEQYVTQFDKDDVEAIGLVKFDFLGLRTLTIIDWAVQSIQDKDLDINKIPTDDAETFTLLKSCQTTAVFQLESRGMKDLIKRLQPDCFEEIIALVALFRPGPLQSGMVDDFINRKHGRTRVVYPHPALEVILKPTYGVIVYQEQVMQIAQTLAGYSLGAADLLRRAMGKKKPEEMAKQREIFIKGALENKVSETIAEHIFDLMEKFAGYGFNKSHSAAYALLAYQTAWLKTHYPAQFMASVLSSDLDNTDKVVIFLEECHAMKLTVLPPNINQGQIKFTVNEQGDIIYGLGAIKGAGEAALQQVIADREKNGPYRDLFDFCRRGDLRKVTKRVLEVLIKSGAMDQLGVHRAHLFTLIPKACQAAEQHAKNQLHNQHDLFGEAAHEEAMEHLQTQDSGIDPWSNNERLQYEQDTLGFYLSGHPFEEYEQEIRQLAPVSLKNLFRHIGNTLLVAGFVLSVRTIKTKRGKLMAILTLDDRTARIEVTAFSEVYEANRQYLEKGQMLVIDGEAMTDDYTGGVRVSAKKIFTLAQAREGLAKRILLQLTPNQLPQDKLDALKQLMVAHREGKCPVHIYYQHPKAEVKLNLPAEWKVTPTESFLQQLREWFSAEAVRVEY